MTSRSRTTEFDDFYLARYRGLVRHLYLVTGDAGRAEECAQEAFMRAWRKWDQLDVADPWHWVRTVAWRLAISEWRRSRRMASALGKVGSVESAIPPDDNVLDVQRLLESLAPPYREVIVLYYFEDMSIADMALVLGEREGTLKSRLSRARAQIAPGALPLREG